jgi:hypothetical protein
MGEFLVIEVFGVIIFLSYILTRFERLEARLKTFEDSGSVETRMHDIEGRQHSLETFVERLK